MGRPRRVALVFNPATGGGDDADSRRRDTEDALKGAGLEVLWLVAAVRGIRLGVAHHELRSGEGGAAGRPWRRSAVRHG